MYGANLIYGVRLRVNVGERQAKKILKCIATLFWKKKKKQKKTKKKKKTLKKTSFVSDEQFRKSSLNVNFF